MIDKDKTAIKPKIYEIIDLLDGWELYNSPKVQSSSILAVNGENAISFGKDRGMIRVIFFIHPDMNFDRKQKVVRNAIRFLPGESAATCVRKMQETFLPKVFEQTKGLRTVNE